MPVARDVAAGVTVTSGTMISVAGASATVGTDEPWLRGEGEDPLRAVTLEPFRISAHATSVADFAAFVRDTGHRTTAEVLGWSFVFAADLDDRAHVVGTSTAAPWWCGVAGATWMRPGGSRAASDDHPAVHLSWRDASAYCAWAGGRLPTEAEWEHAASAGTSGVPFPWGTELESDGEHRCNVWQGSFPVHDTGDDGYRGTAPVDAFPANRWGLHDTIGNVWEWCSDTHAAAGTAPCCTPAESSVARVQKGGSYLCHASYCTRYRIQARIGSAETDTTGNGGFRLAADA